MNEKGEDAGERTCELCGRAAVDLTRHHLIPRTRHKNKRNKKMFDRQEIHQTVDLCRPCHRHIHATLDNKTLEREYNTVEALLSHPDIRRFVEWIRKKPHGTVRRSPRHNDDYSRAS
ncbi:MAG: hypothetical protein CYG60_06820 [Actinobacteria bacterium]|jgi:hypothetical protein|nr:hypothetical protein [Actinomycetota bacterium]PLS86519.1 MAG: hypothetical protein CYG60_06820 [Actinomycetota bacterium]